MNKLSWPVLLVISMAAVASFFPIAKYLDGSVEPLLVSFFRFGVAAVVLLPFVAYRHALRLPPKEEWPLFIFLSLLAVLPTAFVVMGVERTNTIVSAILMNTQALMVAVLAPLLIHEKVTGRKALSLVAGFTGVVLVVLNGQNPAEHVGSSYVWGSIILLGAALMAGLNKTLSRNLVRKYDGLYVTFFPVALGSILLSVVLVAKGDLAPVMDFPPLTFLALIASGIICTAIPWVIWSSSLKHLDVHVAISFNLLIPIFATAYSLVFFNEMFTVWMALGMLLTSISIYVVNKQTPQPAGRPHV